MKLTPQFFVTSDTHFNHDKLIEYGRPPDFNRRIVDNWNRVVGKNDFVLHLGDLTMCGKEETMAYTKRLHGTKFLVRGNHDGNSDGWYMDCGFTTIEPIYKVFSDKYEIRWPFLFTHEPVQDLPLTWYNIHGHLHGDSHRDALVTDRHLDVGVDCFDFTPIRLYDAVNKLK